MPPVEKATDIMSYSASSHLLIVQLLEIQRKHTNSSSGYEKKFKVREISKSSFTWAWKSLHCFKSVDLKLAKKKTSLASIK